MRKQWFGDSRDYVKWTCIRREARGGYQVVYALMLREDSLKGENIDPEVKAFFDRQKDFNKLSELFSDLFVFDEPYSKGAATEYFQSLAKKVLEIRKNKSILLFLDPDTGVGGEKGYSDEHLSRSDLVAICYQLKDKDKLVVYQHAPRRSGWENDWKQKLEHMVAGTGCMLSEPYNDRSTAKDVCFFTFTKLF